MSLKKLKDYENNDIQVESAIKDAKGQTIHSTYAKKSEVFSNPMTTACDIIVGGTSGTPTRLAKGTAGQVLAMNSGGTALEWITIPTAMVFKGTVGTSGTIAWASLPSASSSTGFVYKVITDHNSAPICKVGDTIVSNGSSWVVIPSGDEPSGTVTNVAVSTNTQGLSVGGSPITSNGTITVNTDTGYIIPKGTANGEISSPIEVLTTAPSSANTYGLKIVVLSSEPQQRYDGYLYIIKA